MPSNAFLSSGVRLQLGHILPERLTATFDALCGCKRAEGAIRLTWNDRELQWEGQGPFGRTRRNIHVMMFWDTQEPESCDFLWMRIRFSDHRGWCPDERVAEGWSHDPLKLSFRFVVNARVCNDEQGFSEFSVTVTE